jgi:Na+-translocating ferredoxin:NAD+ oxidoreductase subunit E
MTRTELRRGMIDKNPAFTHALGLCPALAITTAAADALLMGISVLCVLVASNAVVSLTRKWIPYKVRVPCHITIIAVFATMAQLLLKSCCPLAVDRLGIYVPLIAVNCIIIARVNSVAFISAFVPSVIDGVVTGTGYGILLLLCALIRELLGRNQLFGMQVIPLLQPVPAFTLACGGFFAAAAVLGLFNYLRFRKDG